MQRDDDFGTGSSFRRGCQPKGALNIFEPFPYPRQTEMSVARTGDGCRIKAASVVGYREADHIRERLADYADFSRAAVPDGIGDQFADYAQNRMCGCVAQSVAADVEPDGDIGFPGDLLEGDADGGVEILLFKRFAAKIPEAAAKFVEA